MHGRRVDLVPQLDAASRRRKRAELPSQGSPVISGWPSVPGVASRCGSLSTIEGRFGAPHRQLEKRTVACDHMTFLPTYYCVISLFVQHIACSSGLKKGLLVALCGILKFGFLLSLCPA